MTKYGNTKIVAETIAEGLEGHEATISDVEDINMIKLPYFDAILIGSPNHLGAPARVISKFIDSLGKLDLAGKRVTVFDTYMGGDFNKAVSKMEKRLMDNVPDLDLISPGLSIKVDGMKGPVAEGELQKCTEFGRKISGQVES